jgi:hypothetical protein
MKVKRTSFKPDNIITSKESSSNADEAELSDSKKEKNIIIKYIPIFSAKPRRGVFYTTLYRFPDTNYEKSEYDLPVLRFFI